MNNIESSSRSNCSLADFFPENSSRVCAGIDGSAGGGGGVKCKSVLDVCTDWIPRFIQRLTVLISTRRSQTCV